MKRTFRDHRLRRRSLMLLGIMIGWIVVVGGRIAYLQVVQHEAMLQLAQQQHQRSIRISGLRGLIHDRHGRELARSVEVESIYAVPAEIESAETTASRLAQVLHLKPELLLKKLSQHSEFVWIKRKVSQQEAATVKDLRLEGIYFVTEHKRYYPNHQLAASVLGYASIDEVGLDGVELTYDAHLRGQQGYIFVQKDALGRSYGQTQPQLYKGQDITLTIDAATQLEVEKALSQAVEQTRAQSGVALVIQPATGEILALANVPTFDPNKFSTTPEEQRRNRAVREIYEPGSVFKIVTYAAALEEHQATPDENIDCLSGRIILAGHIIRDHRPFQILSLREALENSSNIGAIRLALRVGPEKLAQYIKRFGFGQLTRIDLPGETGGLVRPVEKWSQISIGSIAMGQEVGVSATQMLAAMAAVANDGVWVQPHVVRTLHSRAGDVILETRPQTRRVISQRTARTLKQMLQGVVVRGTGKRARLKGYTAAGKTGTAQQTDPRTGRYSRTRYVASFAGFAPLKNPQVCVLVAIDTPRGQYHGGAVAAPVFQQIAQMALQRLGVRPDQIGPPIRLATWAQELSSEETGGVVVGSEIEPAGGAPARLRQEETLDASPLLTPSGVMPDFKGRGIRAVVQGCARLGLHLEIKGSGLAIRQTPAPGTPIRVGLACEVEFGR